MAQPKRAPASDKKNPRYRLAPYLGSRHLLRSVKDTKVRDFFKSCPWHEWWAEFLTARNKNGQMTHLSAYSFARLKGKNGFERDIIYRAIGAKVTDLVSGERKETTSGREVPYLGDWQLLRARAYFSDNETIEKLKLEASQKLDSLQAGKGAAAIVLNMLAKWQKYDDQIDELFQNQAVQPGVSLAKNARRTQIFFAMKKQTMGGITGLIDKLLQCYGITPNGLNDLGALYTAASNSAARDVLMGTAAGAMLVGGENSPAARMLCGAIADKMRIFNMPPPTAVAEEFESQENEQGKIVVAANGHKV